MSAARYTNRVRTQSQARVTKAQYPGSVSNNYDPLFSSIDCNVSYNVLNYKGVPCICSPNDQPFLFSMRLGRLNRTAAVQFSMPLAVVEPVVTSIDEINTSIAVRMALPPTESNDLVQIPKQEKIRNVAVALSVEHTEIENVPLPSYATTIDRSIGIIGYAQTSEPPQAAVVPSFEGIRNVRVMTQGPVPIPNTDNISYPSYEKLRNVMFKLEVPKPIQSDPTPIAPDLATIPKFEGLRSVGVPVSVPLLTNESVPLPRYETIRNVRITVQVPIYTSPTPSTNNISYPSYEKLRNVTFKIDVPNPVKSDPTLNIPDTAFIRRFEGIRSVGVPVSVPLLTNETLHIRNVPVGPHQQELDTNDITPPYKMPAAYHLPEIRSFHSIQSVDPIQNDYVPVVDQPIAVPIYDINSFRTNPRFKIQNTSIEPQNEIVFGGGSENPDEYVVYGGGNSRSLL